MPETHASPLKLLQTFILGATLFASPLLAHGAHGGTDADPPPVGGETFGRHGDPERPPIGPALDMAEAFLTSPDSGVWSGPGDTFENAAATYDIAGRVIARYQRFYRGLRVLGAGVKVTVDPGTGEVTHNFPPKSFQAPADLDPRIREVRVFDLVADHLRLDLDGLFGDVELALTPRDDAPATLIWRVHARHPEAPPRKLYLDAHTGEVLWDEKGYVESSTDVVGTGSVGPADGSSENREVEIDTLLHDDDNRYFLVDHTRSGSKVMDMEDGPERWNFKGVDYSQLALNHWGNHADWEPGDDTRGPTGQTAAAEALWSAQSTWDMLVNTQDLEGYDGKAAPMLLRVHYRKEEDERYGDANWDGTYANFGDGETPGDDSSTDFAIVAHELGHGVWHHNVSDDNKGEARGLNEGHADIMGALAWHYEELAEGEGGHVPTHERGNLTYFFKRSVNPWSYQAEGEVGLAGYVPSMEHREEHCQGAAYGHMFAILAMGVPSQAEFDAQPCAGKSYTCLAKSPFPLGLAGIGMDRAGFIWREATLKYFDEDPTFHEARDAFLKAAADGFGPDSPEYAAVQNAFYLINVGDPAEDLGPPEIGPTPPVVDHFEGSVLIEAVAVDDIGVVQMTASTGADWRKQPGDHFKGYLAISGLPGAKTATVKAIDGSLAWSESTVPYDFHDADVLFRSDFEDAHHAVDTDAGIDEWRSSGWLISDSAMILHDEPQHAYLGAGFIRFQDGAAMRYTTTIPDGATAAHLGFRYRVDPDRATGAQLRVEIRDQANQVLETGPVFTSVDALDRAFSNHYAKHVYTLSDAYAGQTVTVRFAVLGGRRSGFRLDQVYLAYDAVPTAALDVEVDEREGSVIMDAELSGFNRSRVEYVTFSVDGVEFERDYHWPYELIRSTDLFAKDVPLEMEAVAYDYFGAPIASSGALGFEVEDVDQLLFNGGFENGDAYWDLAGGAGLCPSNAGSGQSHPRFMGQECLRFEGGGTLSRTIWLPDD
ncbi:MAG: M4 family metallopeptidase, partial [Acidobacteriota bacterium]